MAIQIIFIFYRYLIISITEFDSLINVSNDLFAYTPDHCNKSHYLLSSPYFSAGFS